MQSLLHQENVEGRRSYWVRHAVWVKS